MQGKTKDCCLHGPSCRASTPSTRETPDTPSTEALTPDRRWPEGYDGAGDPPEDQWSRQEAADTSAAYDDLMRYFGEVSMGGPLHHGTEQWDRLSREVRRIVASLARQEAADPSGLREAARRWLTENWTAPLDGTAFLRWVESNELAQRHARAALEGATERPLQLAKCVCGAMPPSRPWTPGAADPCLDGNGNWNAGHRYVEGATERPLKHQRQSANGCVMCERRWDQHTAEEKRLPARSS